jgi:RNA polymerase sigma-70 factor (ECF subfamily)
MTEMPETRSSLLLRLRDRHNGAAWGEFVQVYAPLVYQFARCKGLQDADAADVTQEVLRGVSTAVPEWTYDPERGLFRSWLFTLVHRKVCDFFRRRGRQGQGSGDSGMQRLLEEQPAASEEARWNRDYEQRAFAWAAQEVRRRVSHKAWQAFWLGAVENRPTPEVAAELGMSVAAVYLAKSRVMARLKDQIRLLEMD